MNDISAAYRVARSAGASPAQVPHVRRARRLGAGPGAMLGTLRAALAGDGERCV